ncbi:MAG: hypothetical protein IPK26_28720 [Planctomycetes bacterium]|nr:hypothetical protein [Planctomycetota bacterium]
MSGLWQTGLATAPDAVPETLVATGRLIRVMYDAATGGLLPSLVNVAGSPIAEYVVSTADTIWCANRFGDLHRCRRSLVPEPLTPVANLLQAAQTTGTVDAICMNGRDLVYSVNVTVGSTWHVFRLDTTAPGSPATPLFGVPSTTARRGPSLTFGPDGNILVMDHGRITLIDIDTGQPLNQTFLNSPTFNQEQPYIAYNPWNSLVMLCSGGGPFSGGMALVVSTLWSTSWTAVAGSLYAGNAVASTAVVPFEFFGRGCANSTGRDPRLGHQGLPAQGQAFQIHLRRAEPAGFAMFWLGLSSTNWQGLSLPFDASPLGAPGCSVLVSGDVPYPAPVDTNGRASLTVSVPTDPALAGLVVLAQSASTSSANGFGFAASDALRIRVR